MWINGIAELHFNFHDSIHITKERRDQVNRFSFFLATLGWAPSLIGIRMKLHSQYRANRASSECTVMCHRHHEFVVERKVLFELYSSAFLSRQNHHGS